MTTKQQQITDHLYRHGSISPQVAYERYGTWRLAHHVERLRKLGVAVTTVMTTGKTGTRYAKCYRLG